MKDTKTCVTKQSPGPPGRGGNANPPPNELTHTNFLDKNSSSNSDASHEHQPDRYYGLPVILIQYPDGIMRPAPFLMKQEEVAAFFRLHESKTKFPKKTIQRYRQMGLRSVRVGRRVWIRLDDVLRFLDEQQDRLRWA